MDGKKRKLDDHFVPQPDYFSQIRTPTYSASMYHEESALRSTQRQTEQPQNFINPALIPRFTPLNAFRAGFQEPPQPTEDYEEDEPSEEPRQFGRGKGRQQTPAHLPEILTDDDGNKFVDTDDGADEVYFIDCDSGSWSRPLTDEEERCGNGESLSTGAIEAICRLKKADDLSEQLAKLGIQHLSTNNGLTLEENLKWHKDMLLRNVMRNIKSKLSDGAVLTIQRLGDDGVVIPCSHPCCLDRERFVRPQLLYVDVTQPTPSEDGLHFCLLCFEKLWKGHDMHHHRLPNPTVSRLPEIDTEQVSYLYLDGPAGHLDDMHAIPQLDGPTFSPLTTPIPMWSTKEPASQAAITIPTSTNTEPEVQTVQPPIPTSLLSSRHAPTVSELLNPAPSPKPKTPTTEAETPNGSPSSLNSTMSDGTWRYPPTRMQHIASFIVPGSSLTEREKSAILLWKAVSAEQIEWEEHLERAEQARRERADSAHTIQEEKRESYRGTHSKPKMDREELEAKTGLARAECQGQDISTVLAMVRSSG